MSASNSSGGRFWNFVDQDHDRRTARPGRLAGGHEDLGKVAAQRAAVCHSGFSVDVDREFDPLDGHLHRAHETLQDPQAPLDVLAHALDAIELQQDRAQRGNDRYRQRLVVRDLDEVRQRALFLRHGLDFVQQDRLADAAQPHEQEAAGRPAGLVALDRETGVGENGVASRQLRGRRSGAGRIGIYAWVHSPASTWFIRQRHKH